MITEISTITAATDRSMPAVKEIRLCAAGQMPTIATCMHDQRQVEGRGERNSARINPRSEHRQWASTDSPAPWSVARMQEVLRPASSGPRERARNAATLAFAPPPARLRDPGRAAAAVRLISIPPRARILGSSEGGPAAASGLSDQPQQELEALAESIDGRRRTGASVTRFTPVSKESRPSVGSASRPRRPELSPRMRGRPCAGGISCAVAADHALGDVLCTARAGRRRPRAMITIVSLRRRRSAS